MNEELPKMVHSTDVKKPLPATDGHSKIANSSEIAKPLYYQQLERSLNIQPVLSSVESVFYGNDNNDDLSSDSDSEVQKFLDGKGALNGGIVSSKQDLRSDRMRLYNFAQVNEDRAWLQDLLVSDSSDSSEDKDDSPITEEDLQSMLKMHLYKKKYQNKFYTNPENRQYQYYGAGLLSNYDKFPEHQLSIVGSRKKKKVAAPKREKIKKEIKEEKVNSHSFDSQDLDGSRDLFVHETKPTVSGRSGMGSKGKSKKKSQNKDPEVMAYRRRKIWSVMAKKEVGKVQRSRTCNHKEVLTSCRRVAQYCMRYWRQKAMQSQRNMKETIWRAKRLTREMQAYWKRCDRVERETRKRMEKEAEEQRKMDVELMEAKRQQRKLNFLITQTELYAHFMSRKLGGASAEEQLRILSQLEEEKNPRLAAIDDYDSEKVKETVRKNVQSAFDKEFQGEKLEDIGMDQPDEERPQPALFKGALKGYQLKGMNWLANLYDQGINGILADEMGLGKTVQSIAFLCHIAEKYSFWGPFLIISPASTLHNWQQEMARFVPDFKVVPYWGSPQDRKILRQFWDVKGLHTREASFHVVITSYQLVVTDFNMRWKLLLGFSCRNRLLLSGTPIQNSMGELWALLHFIMPTMFDSHEEFNEWFSKDIESHAENKTSIDEKHLSRLHMILKPFMLRRIKKDVENELSDKIEVMVYCPLTTRQKMLYAALKKKIRIEDLLHYSGHYQSAQSITSNLMNLVMQFRKVCNHPELFERREAKSPFFMRCLDYVIPQLIFKEGLLHRAIPSIRHLLYNHLSVMNPNHVHRSLFPQTDSTETSSICDSTFSFTRLIDMSPEETFRLTIGGLINRLLHLMKMIEIAEKFNHRADWWENQKVRLIIPQKRYPQGMVFTAHEGHRCVFSHVRNVHHSCAETIEHRLLRSRKVQLAQLEKVAAQVSSSSSSSSSQASSGSGGQMTRSSSQSPVKKEQANPVSGSPEGGGASLPNKLVLLPEFRHVPRSPRILECHPTVLPAFVYNTQPKIQVRSRDLYASCSEAAWWLLEHNQCSTKTGQDVLWYGSPEAAQLYRTSSMYFTPVKVGGLCASSRLTGWSNISIPDKQTLVTDAGKLYVLDNLLKRLKEQGHRVLIYSQMTRMIDLLEEYMWYRKLTYMRLDGSSKISDRRDMVADFQSRDDIFVFLLSTRAGGLGINLTAADTVIFYDSDWNPTVDQQAMDRAHRLGQTKQVTVYRLICKDTIEERILQRAREKSEIQRMVISGGDFKPDTLKPKEVVSLLLDDEEIEQKYRQKQAERRQLEESRQDGYKEREKERKRKIQGAFKEPVKHARLEETAAEDAMFAIDSAPASPAQSDGSAMQDDTSSDALVVDIDGPTETVTTPVRPPGMKTRGRPRLRRGMPGRSPASPSQFGAHYQHGALSPARGMSGVKRGPGRPRLKPVGGPANQGSRSGQGHPLQGHFMAGLANFQNPPPPPQSAAPQPPSSQSPSPTPSPVSDPIKPFGYYTQDLELVLIKSEDIKSEDTSS
ncbi:hypothetical protein LSTR_LSTR009705 [Laodelphax striatellus]|uniref:Chromatin-remodeling ATPase INO80 n=1 Tax=Laodelphax striatellus TaxID=195883 RepID=A0A482WVV4_LAOST|nr:hypothetical protein LSTR_LSTR009705 [Laodelphax striatellus]